MPWRASRAAPSPSNGCKGGLGRRTMPSTASASRDPAAWGTGETTAGCALDVPPPAAALRCRHRKELAAVAAASALPTQPIGVPGEPDQPVLAWASATSTSPRPGAPRASQPSSPEPPGTFKASSAFPAGSVGINPSAEGNQGLRVRLATTQPPDGPRCESGRWWRCARSPRSPRGPPAG